VQVTREAFSRYMRVIKRALTDAAVKESGRAAEVALALPQEPASAEQTAGEAATDLCCATQNLAETTSDNGTDYAFIREPGNSKQFMAHNAAAVHIR